MKAFNTIRAEKDGPACVLTLSRPDRRNAISVQMMGEIVKAIRALDSDAEVRGVIITGGNDYFAAGADLTEALKSKTAEQASITSAIGIASVTRSRPRKSRLSPRSKDSA